MFRRKDSAFDSNFLLEDIENMLPYERDYYMILINQKIEEHNQNQGKK